MRGAKPFVFIPIGLALFAAGVAATWPFNTMQFWIWGGVAGTASATTIWIILTPGSRPDIDLKEAVEIMLGSARWQGPGRKVPFDKLVDAVEGLSRRAANGQVTIWGRRIAQTDFRGRQAAVTKIPPEYWRRHRIDVAAFAANQRGVTEPLTVREGVPVSEGAYSHLRFDRAEIRKFRRHWQRHER